LNFIEIANTEARERAEADPNVAVILVGPDDRFALSDMMREDGRLEIVHRENFGIDGRDCVYVECEDEWAVEGLEKAWVHTCGSGACCRREMLHGRGDRLSHQAIEVLERGITA
jgi:hypothetical protein